MFSYAFLRLVVFIFSFIPFFLLQRASLLFYFLVFYLLRLRRKQVRKDLLKSFPEKPKRELIKIEQDIYKNMCQMLCETLKSFSMKKEAMLKRVCFKNPEYLDNLFKQKKSCVLYFSHSYNWEWLVSMGIRFPDEAVDIYKRIHNKFLDDYILSRRTFFGGGLVDQRTFPRYLTGLMRKNFLETDPKAFIMIADQRPRKSQESISLNFLNRKTDFLVGPEKMARRFDLEMIYLKMTQKKIGYYEISFVPFGKPSQEEALGTLTKKLVTKLESEIREDPKSWFWLHNRWKES